MPKKKIISPIESPDDAGVGVPGLFQPQDCDIQEELQNNEALRQYRQEIDAQQYN
jgi:hypothetical protein